MSAFLDLVRVDERQQYARNRVEGPHAHVGRDAAPARTCLSDGVSLLRDGALDPLAERRTCRSRYCVRRTAEGGRASTEVRTEGKRDGAPRAVLVCATRWRAISLPEGAVARSTSSRRSSEPRTLDVRVPGSRSTKHRAEGPARRRASPPRPAMRLRYMCPGSRNPRSPCRRTRRGAGPRRKRGRGRRARHSLFEQQST